MTSVAKKLIEKSKSELPIYKDAKYNKNLIDLINVYPKYGIGLKVIPYKWIKKGNLNSYYEVSSVKLKNVAHGRIFGIKYYKGKMVTKKEKEVIKWTYSNNWHLWPYEGKKDGIWH
ncbi:11039_t:CDS:2 [Entrophospora sp. SA101]|nr:10816_t:CDS:2 [Entrophospora candida]CAG8597410.1 11773_t:CDS:2 [Entrophospora candida]CAJ0768482.1 11039_t:CDS:2 [Entrophospora sp. SA101]